MAVSRDTGYRRRSAFWRRLSRRLTRYDLVLTVIPAALAVALLAHAVLSVPLVAALAAAALVSGAAVADALFVNPPVAERSGGA
jgi:NhaP-type Na+/H+ or K+/H+ antiporter